MTKTARYSTFKASPVRHSWIIRRIAQPFASHWLLLCCCDSCSTEQKITSESDGEKIPTSSIGSAESEDDGNELVMEEILLHDRGVSKNDVTQNEDGTLLINRKNGSSDSKSPSGSGALTSGMKRVINNLPGLPRKEKKSPSPNRGDDKNVSESDSEMGHSVSIFAKCSKRYGQQKANVPQLIIS